MLRHMITLDCPLSCDYCITRNVPREKNTPEVVRFQDIEKVYVEQAVKGHKQLTISGGEPTLEKHRTTLMTCVGIGHRLFTDGVFLATSNADFLKTWRVRMFDGVMFSPHGRPGLPWIRLSIPVYLSILAGEYHTGLPTYAQAKGFSGLTIQENQRGDAHFDAPLPDLGSEFTYRVNHQNGCANDTVILPDLLICEDFSIYL